MLDAYPASGPEGGAACRLPTQAGRELRVGAVSRPRQGTAPPRGWLGPTREHVPPPVRAAARRRSVAQGVSCHLPCKLGTCEGQCSLAKPRSFGSEKGWPPFPGTLPVLVLTDAHRSPRGSTVPCPSGRGPQPVPPSHTLVLFPECAGQTPATALPKINSHGTLVPGGLGRRPAPGAGSARRRVN